MIDSMLKMDAKFKVSETVAKMDKETLGKFWGFRIEMMYEELQELVEAENDNDAVDAIIDLMVFAHGTLVALKVDVKEAWDKVWLANMMKSPGVKKERPNPLGLPDLIKPTNWVAPSHEGNTGLIGFLFSSVPQEKAEPEGC